MWVYGEILRPSKIRCILQPMWWRKGALNCTQSISSLKFVQNQPAAKCLHRWRRLLSEIILVYHLCEILCSIQMHSPFAYSFTEWLIFVDYNQPWCIVNFLGWPLYRYHRIHGHKFSILSVTIGSWLDSDPTFVSISWLLSDYQMFARRPVLGLPIIHILLAACKLLHVF